MAPMLTIMDNHVCPVFAKTATTGAFSYLENNLNGTTPVMINVMMMYKIVEITSESKMPLGSVLLGLIVSSALDETASKPMNEKKTIEAAGMIPVAVPL